VSGRAEVGFDEWVRMDIRYANSRSVPEDLKLLFRTVPALMSRRGAH
jgi:lipopolysaccharide/colanic/teichoic acid biosynthesis glycosyltransferase